MKLLALMCLIVAITASKQKRDKKKKNAVDEELARQALDQLTFTREEQIYNIALDVSHDLGNHRTAENHVTNVCSFYQCSEGKVCVITETNDPACICADSCFHIAGDDTYVCSTMNITYLSKCEFYRQKCIKAVPDTEDLHYFGQCRALPPCQISELQEFPHRLRDWFTEVMFSLANVEEHLGGLSMSDRELIMSTIHSEQRHVVPVQWKFRSLDRHPKDNFLSQEELVPLKAALIPSEHCASVFFAMCDSNIDLLLDSREWNSCMGLTPDEIEG